MKLINISKLDSVVFTKPVNLPEWARTVYADTTKEEIYIPVESITTDIEMVFHCLSFDGVPVLIEKGHVYAPAAWLVMECPPSMDEITAIKEKVMSCVLEHAG